MQLSGQGGHGASILLVHPVAADRAVIADALASLPGLGLFQAADLAQAVALAARPDVAVVVLALDLPDSHGLATLNALRAARVDAAVVVLVDDAGLGRLAMRQGAKAFVAVPVASIDEAARQARHAVGELRAQGLAQDLARRIGDRTRRAPFPPGSPAAIAHDFNNLLQIIINAAEELREAGLPEPHAQTAEAILAAARRSIALARELHASGRKPDERAETPGWPRGA
jgi:DNA-binding NarL/FixJ family response regulator